MNLIDKISDNEKEMIIYYIDEYAEFNKNIDLQNSLYYWNIKKSKFLAKLFHGELILSKNLLIEKSDYELINELDNILYDNTFIKQYNKYIYRTYLSTTNNNLYRLLMSLINPYNLIKNTYPGETFTFNIPNNKNLTIHTGSKIIKLLGKLAKIFNLDGYEEFRIKHSMILNQKKYKGNLCLSIHPLDYLTMSDNDCNWDSCMSWKEYGSYRRGTIEMMNSPMVIVAYLSAEEPYKIGNYVWNNKKWRELFIVNENIISNVKGYPYQSDILDDIIMSWIKELAEKQNIYYEDNKYKVTNHKLNEKNIKINYDCGPAMYNDCKDQLILLNKKIVENTKDLNKIISINYSGPSTCIACGNEIELEEEECLICNKCLRLYKCNCCEDYFEEKNMININDEFYCKYCVEQYTSFCNCCEKIDFYDNMIEVHIKISDNFITKNNFYICQDCFNKGLFNKNFNEQTIIQSITLKYFWGSTTYHYIDISQITNHGIQNILGWENKDLLKEYYYEHPDGLIDIS